MDWSQLHLINNNINCSYTKAIDEGYQHPLWMQLAGWIAWADGMMAVREYINWVAYKYGAYRVRICILLPRESKRKRKSCLTTLGLYFIFCSFVWKTKVSCVNFRKLHCISLPSHEYKWYLPRLVVSHFPRLFLLFHSTIFNTCN